MVETPSWFARWLADNPDAAAVVRQQVRERVAEALASQDEAHGLARRVAARQRMIDFATYTYPLYVAEPWNQHVAGVLDRVVAGEIRRLIISAPPQHGKCIARGQKVLLADGRLVPIEDVRHPSTVISLDSGYSVVAKTTVATCENGIKPVLKVSLQSGREIVCTENHPLLTILGWQEIGSLKTGDHVATLRQVPAPEGDPLPDGFAALLGYLTGDGSFSKGVPEVTASEVEVVEHLQKIAASHGWVLRPHGKYGYFIRKPARGKRDGTSAVERLRQYMLPAKSAYKRVPACIFTANRADLCAFLAAYFNCDATVNGDREGVVEFYSVSKGLLDDVQHLLSRLGIFSSLRQKRGRYQGERHLSWRLIIRGSDMLTFANVIPAIGERGRKLRSVAEAQGDKWRNPEHDAIPNGWQSYLTKSLWWHRLNSNVRADKKYKYGTDRRVVLRLAEAENNSTLRQLCAPNIVWDRIVGIEDAGEEQTYDLEISETHNFVVGGNVVVHNSHLASVLFPAYWMGKRPDDPVILTSYAGSLAEDKSRQARDIVEGPEFRELFPAVQTRRRSRAITHWKLDQRLGSLLAVGVGGAITGHGARLGIIDDPFASWQDAYRQTVRDRIWDWYRGTFRTRIWENGAIIIIMTRWHGDDIVGRLIADQSENWHILRLPAMAESQEERDINNKFVGLPAGLPDVIGREAGAPLSPKRFSVKALLEIMKEVGQNAWAAEYQGVPRPTEGSLFHRSWFKLVDAVPAEAQRVRYWDLASGESMRNDQTAGVLMAKTKDGLYYVEHVVCGRFSAYEVQQTILNQAMLDADKYGNSVDVWIEQEGGSGGKISTDAIIRLLGGFPVHAQRALTNKEVAAKPFAAQCEAGNVRVLRANWTSDYIDEMTAFPFGRNDDQVDGSSGAFNKLAGGLSFGYGFA